MQTWLYYIQYSYTLFKEIILENDFFKLSVTLTLSKMAIITRQSVAVQREGGIPVGNKVLHPYQNPWTDPSRSARLKWNGAAVLIQYGTCWSLCSYIK